LGFFHLATFFRSMSRSAGLVSSRFPILLENIGPAKGRGPPLCRILCVFSSGEVLIHPIRKDRNDYIAGSSEELHGHLDLFPTARFSQLTHLDLMLTDLVAHTTHAPIECIYRFTPIANCQQMHAELSPSTTHLMIYGMMHHSVPAVGVFEICEDPHVHLKLIYTDSILAVCDVSVSDTKIAVIPRVACGAIAVMDIPHEVEPYEHRILPTISFVGTHGDQMRHLALCPAHQLNWQWLSWSDSERPVLSLWHLPEATTAWDSLAFEFLEPAWIQAAQFHPTAQKIGIVVATHNQTVAGVWEILGDQSLLQVNFVCEGIGQFVAAQWSWQLKLGKDTTRSFFVIGTSGMIEIFGNNTFFWPQPTSPLVLFRDLGSTRFYVNRQMELRVMNLADLDKKFQRKELPAQPARRLSLLRIVTHGVKDVATVMHMYRCANCRLPLMCPLVSRHADGSFQQCYCSKKCQRDHWPLFVATRKPVVFDLDD
jgi:hypothetical protein